MPVSVCEHDMHGSLCVHNTTLCVFNYVIRTTKNTAINKVNYQMEVGGYELLGFGRKAIDF